MTMMENTDEEAKATEVAPPSDPWAAAFEAVEQASKASTEATESAANSAGQGAEGTTDPQATDGNTDASSAQPGEGTVDAGEPGGILPGDGGDGQVSGDTETVFEGYTTEEIDAAVKGYQESAEQQALTAVRDHYIKQNAMHNPDTKALGAYVEHPDICKKDRDGVPRFYNPETGKEFTGENPRRQAQEWCEDYNKELAQAFNRDCQKVIDNLMKEHEPEIETMRFSGTYAKLDPVRQAMFDSLIEDYEVTNDKGEVIGYSCDLNKALEQVNRQVASLRQYTSTLSAKPAATGPALDMPTGNSTVRNGERPEFKSIEEAMEWEQDQLLAKLKK